MNVRTILSYLWKVPVCGLGFVLGNILGSVIAGIIGLETPAMPEGTVPGTILLFQLLASPILALALAFVSRGIQGGYAARWLMLSLLTWLASGVNTVIEASIFTTFGAASTFTVVMWLAGSLLCCSLVALLFPPTDKGQAFLANLRAFFASRPARQWAWRLPVACVAFMPIYYFFGRLVIPFTYEYYKQNLLELTIPGWGQILPVLFVRSVFFLVASLPIVIAWQQSRRNLVLSLGFAMFVLVGALLLIPAYWYPLTLRVPQSLEILADSMVYALVLVILLTKPRGSADQDRVPDRTAGRSLRSRSYF